MNRILSGLIVLSLLSVSVFLMPVYAQKSQGMTDAHINRIKENCEAALTTLGRLHAHDTLQYINSNQSYFSISDKLMARLNSRVTLNRYDATNLVRLASDYNTALNDFRTFYKAYDDTMAELIKIDCKKVPVTFYDKVTEAREQRGKVHDAVVELQTLLGQYRQEVEVFKTKNFTEKQQ